ncbi:MAG: four helix bundle protein [Patiriisocius sp.]|jgi:four helix bundle protein
MESLFEVETQLIICAELGFLSKNDPTELNNLINTEAKMVNALMNKIKNS